MNRERSRTWLSFCALAGLLAACAGDTGSDSASRAVTRAASQQGTAGGFADYDGDGVDDLFVGAPYAVGTDRIGAVFVYQGSAGGFAAEATWTLTGGDNFGFQFANVGDVDGDGVAEFAVTALNGDGARASLCGSVTVYRGGSQGQILATLGGEQALDKFGYSLTGNCDLNADGHGDLVVGAISHSPSPETYLGGAVYVYFGPDLAEASRVKLPATAHTGILGFSSACGDVNNDAVDDLVISAIWTHGVRWHASQVLAYYGRAGFAPTTDAADVTIASAASHFGDGLAVLDDLDGDGFREIAIGVPAFYVIPFPMETHKGVVYLVKGGAGARTVNLSPPRGEPLPADLLTTIYGTAHQERFGSTVLALDDLDGDGVGEFAVSALHGDADGATGLATGQVTGKVYVFLGKDVQTDGSATQAAAASSLSRGERDLHYGTFLAPFEQGGVAKLLVGAPTANRLTGTVYVEALPDGQ
ncbi:MAG TPA: integrin alpha [Deferrisomatales bacterium]|nr:integrin alpha [Deferrisomatales bacterium]